MNFSSMSLFYSKTNSKEGQFYSFSYVKKEKLSKLIDKIQIKKATGVDTLS